ncbi:hypothetical protein [Nostoc sp.]
MPDLIFSMSSTFYASLNIHKQDSRPGQAIAFTFAVLQTKLVKGITFYH